MTLLFFFDSVKIYSTEENDPMKKVDDLLQYLVPQSIMLHNRADKA